MIYLSKLKHLGLTAEESNAVMCVLNRSELNGMMKRFPDAGLISPVKCYDQKEADAVLFEKAYLPAVAKYVHVRGGA